MITYKEIIQVYLDKKHVGDIKKIHNQAYYYQPKGSKVQGNIFTSVALVKRSLEEA